MAPGPQVESVVVDFTAANAAQRVFTAVQALGWPVDYLINNAGFGGGAFVTRSTARDLAMVQVNAAVPTALLKLFLPGMVARGHGRVLNVASIATWFPGPEQATYFATKAYLAALSNALWYELKPLGIRVTTLRSCPDRLRRVLPKAADPDPVVCAGHRGGSPNRRARRLCRAAGGKAPSDRRGDVVDALGGPLLSLVAETVGVGRDCGLTTAPPVTAGRLENNVKL